MMLLAAQSGLVAIELRDLSHRGFVGDETGYVERARDIVQHGALRRGAVDVLSAEEGRASIPTEIRPPGYPLVIALVSTGQFEPAALRVRVACLQLLGVLGCVVLGFVPVVRSLQTPWRELATVLLGAAPWWFDRVSSIYPDSITATLAFASLMLLWRHTQTREPLSLFVGCILMSTTLLFRPEMIVISAVMILATLVLAGLSVRSVLIALTGFLLAVSLQFGYRIHFTGDAIPKLFPPWRMMSSGALRWAATWAGTEHQAHGVVFSVAEGRVPVIPENAIACEWERERLRGAMELLAATGHNSPEVDEIFRKVADHRRAEMPFGAIALPKVTRTALLWLNTNTSSQLLNLLKSVSKPVRRPILGLLLIVRFGTCLAFVFVVVLACRRRLPGPWRSFVLLSATLIATRTLLIGAVLDLPDHRYVLLGWLPLLVSICFPWKFSEKHPALDATAAS